MITKNIHNFVHKNKVLLEFLVQNRTKFMCKTIGIAFPSGIKSRREKKYQKYIVFP